MVDGGADETEHAGVVEEKVVQQRAGDTAPLGRCRISRAMTF